VSDFLSNLMDRALGRAPTLERRRPSTFEPVAAERGRAIALETAAEEEEMPLEAPVRHSTREPAAQPNPLPAEPGRAPQPAPALLWRPEAVAPFAPTTGTSRQASEMQARKEPGEPMRPSAQEAIAAGPILHSEIRASVIHTREIVREREIGASPGEAAKGAAPQAYLAAPVLKPSKAPDVPPALPLLQQKPILIPVAALTPLKTPRSAPASIPPVAPQSRLMPSARRAESEMPAHRRAARVAQEAAQPAGATAPIHISIGSIEIRTPQAPPPSRSRTQPGGPKLKLDDYLAGRRGGRR
jgi:hypothetical protein